MYINSKHLQILDLIKSNPDFTLKHLSEILDMSQQHLKLYLKDIYEEILEKTHSTTKVDDMLNKILYFKEAKKILRKSQQFTKNQKIFYFLFFLSKFNSVNLCNISKELDLTPRNLNNYKEIINCLLKKYNLKLKISSQGVKLTGSAFNLRRLHYFLLFKFIIERNYLPYKFRKDVLNNLNFNNFFKLNRDIYNFLNLLNTQHSMHQQSAIFSLWVAFRGNEYEKTTRNLSFNQSLKYKPGHWNKEFFYKIFYFLKNSSFNEIRTESLYLLFNVIDTFCYSKVCFNNLLDSDAKSTLNIFSKYLKKDLLTNSTFFSITHQWIYYCKLKQLFFIDDFSLITLNLTNIPNSNILNATKEIKQIIPNFTIFEGILLWFIFSKNEIPKEINIFVFKNLEKKIVPIIISEIYKKHNVQITEA
ncbi:hypothetical protein HMPREF0202_01839, partial [Cetobacterium somerae ATCC BAA-474]